MQAGETVIEADDCPDLAFFAQLSRGGVIVVGLGRLLPSLQFLAFGIDMGLLMLIGFGFFEHANGDHMLFDDIADLGYYRRRVTPAFLEITALRIEYAT